MSTRTSPARTALLGTLLALLLVPAAVASPQEAAPPRSGADVRPPAQLAVSPSRFEVELGAKPTVQSARLINMSSRDVTVEVSVVPWDLDDDSRVRLLTPDEQSIDQWMVFNPREFTVPANSEQTVRFSIRPRVRPAEGEHRGMIYFQEKPAANANGTQVQVLFKLGVAVYAYAGEIRRAATLQGLKVASSVSVLEAAFDIESTGNAHVRLDGQYAIWPKAAFPGVAAVSLLEGLQVPGFVAPAPVVIAGSLPSTPVLARTRRQILLTGGHSLPPGDYVLSAIGTLGGVEVREAAEFAVPTPGSTAAAKR